jgi:hypothetical protein
MIMAREKKNECTGVETRPFGEFVSEPSKSKIECNGERTPSESESLSYALSTNFLNGHVEVELTSARTVEARKQSAIKKRVVERDRPNDGRILFGRIKVMSSSTDRNV